MLPAQYETLDSLVKQRFGVLVAEFDGYERELLPDFRDYDGVRLEKFAVRVVNGGEGGVALKAIAYAEYVTAPTVREAEWPSLHGPTEPAENLEGLADAIVGAVISNMRTVIGGRDVSLCFLDNLELPAVYSIVPLHPNIAARDDEHGVRVRHVFAVRPAGSGSGLA